MGVVKENGYCVCLPQSAAWALVLGHSRWADSLSQALRSPGHPLPTGKGQELRDPHSTDAQGQLHCWETCLYGHNGVHYSKHKRLLSSLMVPQDAQSFTSKRLCSPVKPRAWCWPCSHSFTCSSSSGGLLHPGMTCVELTPGLVPFIAAEGEWKLDLLFSG